MKLSLDEIKRVLPIAKRRLATKLVCWVQRILSDEKLIKNVFKSEHKRRVLLCHLPEAFATKELPKHHSNLTECRTAAECFHKLGYRVDCTSRANTGIDYSPYDIVFGINGNAFFGSFQATQGKEPLRIFYSVGAQMGYNFDVTANRNASFHARHGLWLLESNRYVPGGGMNHYEARLSDAVICLGDSFVVGRFTADDPRPEHYRQLSAFYFPTIKPDEKKDFEKCRNNILWFGSMGLIHKGLDIAIDFALAHREFTLHICGSSSNEKDFWHYYSPKIKGASNIIQHGFVDIESEKFANLLNNCALLLNPSISEGGAVSVLNILGNGALMPIYSRGTGLDLKSVGTEVEEVTYNAFEQALLQAAAMPAEMLSAKAWAAHKLVNEKYTLENYRNNLLNHIEEIIKKSDKK